MKDGVLKVTTNDAMEQAYKNGYEKGYEVGKKHTVEPCGMCNNARVDRELSDDNDSSAYTIGTFDKDCRIMLCSGWGKPLRIEVSRWSDKMQRWEDIGLYYPKHCPNCGREITEYKK